MSREHLKKPEFVVKREPEKIKDQGSTGITKIPAIPMTAVQIQRAKAKLEHNRVQIGQQAELVGVQNEARAKNAQEAQVQRQADQNLKATEEVRVQRALEAQVKREAFFSSFKPAVQRQHIEGLQGVKASGIQTSDARAAYQAAIVPEIVQRLVNAAMSVQAQASRATQKPNSLNTRTDWFNTELPLLRARHNNPDKPDFDTKNVFEPSDTRAKDLGITYMRQRLSSGLTPKDAASAILSIQSARDRNHALTGLLNYVPSNQSDHSSIQRLVAEGEANFELQRQALFQDDALQARAFQLAKDEANPTKPNAGISEKINAKRGAGEALSMNVRLQLEAGLNVSLEAVRVHTDGEADILAKSVHAIAFTTGKDIFFSSGSYNPNTKSGYELIAHEVTHTVQQASGQVKPGIDKDSSLESAAQSKGAELAAKFDPNAKEITSTPTKTSTTNSSLNAVQRSPLTIQRDADKALTEALKTVQGLLKTEQWEAAAKLLKALPASVLRTVAKIILKTQPKASIVKVTVDQLVDILKGTAGRISRDILEKLNKLKGFEKGAWKPKGNQPINAYIGTEVHQKIADAYEKANPGDFVYKNYFSVNTILKQKFPNAKLPEAVGEKFKLNPDILNVTKKHLYEIKPEASVADAVIERDVYIALFKMAGIDIYQGPSNALGANGVVQAPGGHAIYYSPLPGVILYRKKNGDFDPKKVPITAMLEEKQKQQTPAIPGTTPALAQSSLPEPLENLRLSMGLSVTGFLIFMIFRESARIWFPPANFLPFP